MTGQEHAARGRSLPKVTDSAVAVLDRERHVTERAGLSGLVIADLWSAEAWAEHEAHRHERFGHLDPDLPIDAEAWAEFAAAHEGDLLHATTRNLVTRVGDQFYGERAAGIASPPAQVTGMQLGTGTTAVAKTGAGATIVTLVASSLVAIDATWPTSSLATNSRRIQWKVTWGAGVATASGIAEVVLTNQSTGTQTAVPEANSFARALLSPTVNKGASDTLAITWNHDLLGA